jgi:protocatechuate 3,4-dioxygenase, alpha subunit
MNREPEKPGSTPSQTVGPFFQLGLTANPELGCMIPPGGTAKGERIRLRFRLFDGDGAPVPDGMIELWQSDAAGRYDHPAAPASPDEHDPAFCGFGRLETDAEGACTFDTVRPGRVPDGRGSCQAPHISVSVFARGLLHRVCTRVYFEGDPALAEDPILPLVPAERRQTLMARRGSSPGEWTFDIHLQGPRETVFFDV